MNRDHRLLRPFEVAIALLVIVLISGSAVIRGEVTAAEVALVGAGGVLLLKPRSSG